MGLGNAKNTIVNCYVIVFVERLGLRNKTI